MLELFGRVEATASNLSFKLCKCGCRNYLTLGEVKIHRDFKQGHKKRWIKSLPIKHCRCGCGKQVNLNNQYILGHSGKKNYGHKFNGKLCSKNGCNKVHPDKTGNNNVSKRHDVKIKLREKMQGCKYNGKSCPKCNKTHKAHTKGHKYNGFPCPKCGKTHKDKTGDNNVSKRPEVREKKTKSQKGKSHERKKCYLTKDVKPEDRWKPAWRTWEDGAGDCEDYGIFSIACLQHLNIEIFCIYNEDSGHATALIKNGNFKTIGTFGYQEHDHSDYEKLAMHWYKDCTSYARYDKHLQLIESASR